VEGTPAYLPPEVLSGSIHQSEAATQGEGSASDAWALGCLLLFLLDGKPPFYGDKDQVVTTVLLFYHGNNCCLVRIVK